MDARVVLVRDDAVVASWPLRTGRRPDLALVDRLARARLDARRAGYDLRVCHPGDELVGLLDLVGLRVEMCGQPEGGEEIGVEEVVVTDDPVA